VDREGYYVISAGGVLQVKQLLLRGNGVEVVSCNPEYPSWTAGSDLQVRGRVVLSLTLRQI